MYVQGNEEFNLVASVNIFSTNKWLKLNTKVDVKP